ncbi:MAG: hypothetical protein ACRESK_05990 [Gammaproteobacteria bacterium]
MDYDDIFETLDELLTTVNDAVKDEADMDSTGTAVPYFSYMFDKEDDIFEDLDVVAGAFKLSPLH